MDVLINIDVPDLEKAIAFYEHGIGLRLARRLFGGTVAEMLNAPVPIYLLAKDAGTCIAPGITPTTSSNRDYQRHWTPVHLDFVVENIDAAILRATAAGAVLESEKRSYPWGHLATFADPFGNGLCFVQWLGSGYDSAAD